ncbi:MAG: tRNA uridine(34) 5-carboxymethylaminomethyl modification radical SAM/GNAT enzyme Elp3 [Myxococcota bacterium]|nr:tRNA uridine(34) 5-carboxymethylaminomethyl modification radical SAM/GNAT enzyme Elp3 [Myxococcota bacterium]
MSTRTPERSRRDPQEHGAFDPESHRTNLLAIVREVDALPDDGAVVAPEVMEAILRRHPRDGRGFYSRAQLIAGARHLGEKGLVALDVERFVSRIRMRPVRTQSGVTPLTVLTKPFPCPGGCVFCPNDVRMPKSYLADEPGAQRAALNDFDPYLQTWNRLATYKAIGHPVAKIEMIILGGTWSSHPEPYQVWFVKRCFDAINDFGNGRDGRGEIMRGNKGFGELGIRRGEKYNDVIRSHLKSGVGDEFVQGDERAEWIDLEKAHHENESAPCRSVGLVVETRPDHLSVDEVRRIRRLGCTKVQIGYQSLSDAVLSANKRGHTVAETRAAMALLRSAGFKIHAHWMPNLLAATPESDIEDFGRLFGDPDFRPDELKIYPCSLIETAELMQFYERNEWRPYEHGELLDVISSALAEVPRYCRVTRVIRDISSDDIVEGNKLTNFRQIAEQELIRRGGACRDIRAREIRSDRLDLESLELKSSDYETGIGTETFFEFVTPEDRIAGFARLSLPSREADLDELRGSALLREVHVYGATTEFGVRSSERTQHRGLGQTLVDAAADRAREAGFPRLSVISAVGTRGWYRRFGFTDGDLYQHRELGPEGADSQ